MKIQFPRLIWDDSADKKKGKRRKQRKHDTK